MGPLNQIEKPVSKGCHLLADPTQNQGLCFSVSDREKLKLRGLIPGSVFTKEAQLFRALATIRARPTPLDKYLYLQSILETNQTLYYRLLVKHTHELMPIVYTPTVGQVCVDFSRLYRQTLQGLFISLRDKGMVRDILENWPHEDVRAIVVTDGERILGLGDLGINGMGIPIGKLALYTACGGIHPQHCLPVVLDVGTNRKEFWEDPAYMGLRQPRERGHAYDDLVDEFISAAKERFGRSVLIQFEDFGNSNAFRLLHKYQPNTCTFNDDIQGTASVALAGLIAAVPVTGKSLAEHTFLFLGAGEAGTGIAELIALAISKETGKSVADARKQIWLVDSTGLVVASRINSLAHHKLAFAHEHSGYSTFVDAVRGLRPTAIIGVCTMPCSFNEEVCRLMSTYNERPIIFALSNPTSKAECTAEQAIKWTGGRCIFASGSPFDAVEFESKRFIPGQGNNAYIFPGVGLAALAARPTGITDEMMYIAAKTLANMVTEAEYATVTMYPPLRRIREASLAIATVLAEHCYATGVATNFPKPSNLLEYCQSIMYDP